MIEITTMLCIRWKACSLQKLTKYGAVTTLWKRIVVRSYTLFSISQTTYTSAVACMWLEECSLLTVYNETMRALKDLIADNSFIQFVLSEK